VTDRHKFQATSGGKSLLRDDSKQVSRIAAGPSRAEDDGVDRRVRKTRSVLRAALLELMLERGWDAVSVRDICQRADVGRSTFYVHFADKENLLLSGFDDLHHAMEQFRIEAKSPFGFLLPLIEHAADNRRLVEALIGRQSGQRVHWRFRDVLAELVRSELVSLGVPEPQLSGGAHFVAGGTAEMLMAWLEHPRGVAAEHLAETLRRYALAVTKSLHKSR
jgi:AcrR family transcriptional regulator